MGKEHMDSRTTEQEQLTHHLDQDRGRPGQASDRVGSRAAVNALMLPAQRLYAQLLPSVQCGGVLVGPVIPGIWIGVSPAMQGQAGVEHRLDGAGLSRC